MGGEEVRWKTVRTYGKILATPLIVKGEDHSIKLTFLFSPIASKHSAFPLTEVLASEVPVPKPEFVPEKIRLERSDFGGHHFQLVLAARPCLCDIIPSDSKLVGRGKTCS